MHHRHDSIASRTPATLLSLALIVLCQAREAALASPVTANNRQAPASQEVPAAQEEPNLPAPDPGLEADLQLLRRLDQPFGEAVVFEDAPVTEVLERVTKETGLRVFPDRHVLADGGGWKLKTVTCTPQTPRAALDAVVRTLGEGLDSVRLDVASGVLIFTDTGGLRALRAKRIYRIGDLLRALTTVTGGATGEPLQLLADEVFADLLYQSVIPDDWTANGGDLAQESIVGELLILTATPATHLLIERTLEEFRAGVPIEPVLWTITLRALPNDLDPTVERRLIAAGAEEYDRKSDLPGEVVSRPTILAQPTEPATVEIGNESERWKIEIAPNCDAGRCTYAIVTEYTTGAGDTQRTSRSVLHAAVGAPSAAVFTVGEGAAARRFLVHAIGNQPALAKKIAPKGP